jgi:hypothetical protein
VAGRPGLAPGGAVLPPAAAGWISNCADLTDATSDLTTATATQLGYGGLSFTIFGLFKTPAVWPGGGVGWMFAHNLNYAGAYHLNGGNWNFVGVIVNNAPASVFFEDTEILANDAWYFAALGFEMSGSLVKTSCTPMSAANANAWTSSVFAGTRNNQNNSFHLGNFFTGGSSALCLMDEWGTITGCLPQARLETFFQSLKAGTPLL